ncbi:MAG TPA: EAL domain-containing protein [Allosphingosinicella sp.]
MLRVFVCIAQEHDLRLVAAAGIICLLAAITAFSAFQQAQSDVPRRPFWICVAGLVSGLGIWATHFVAMLAYQPHLPIGYDVPTTLLSVIAAIAITGLGWCIALHRHPAMPALAGAVVGAGVATMHYVGMSAVEVAGYIVWDRAFVAGSVAAGVALGAAALSIHRRNGGTRPWGPALLLAAAICSLHFTAMAAAVIYPNLSLEVPVESIDSGTLAVIVIAAALVILSAAFGLVLFERGLARAQLAEARERAALADEIVRGAAEREALTEALKRQAAINIAALDNMAQGLSMYDEYDRLVTSNARYAELYGLPPHLLRSGTPLIEILSYLTANGVFPGTANYYAEQSSTANTEASHTEVELLTGRIIDIQRRPLPGGGWVATHEDVTQVRQASAKAAYLAAHDVLTGLPNRVSFSAHLRAAAERALPGAGFALHTIDLDRFKEVNDTLGHAVGDQILKETAARLRSLVKRGDVVTRLGGDEFAVLQHDVANSADAAALAAGFVEKVAEPFVFDGHTVAIGASVGISLAPENGAVGDELLKMSDVALYRAKAERRGMYRFFEAGMDLRLRERRELEADLQAAISEGQFEVHYQPLLNLRTGKIGCFEALVRWRHPTRGMVQPLDFIGIAEESGLIIAIGEWVLRQACRDAAAWPEDVRVAVNLSPAQFKRGDLLAMTTNALAAADLQPSRLELEITESVLLHDEQWVRSILHKLTRLGVRIAMDDFGTGYSSLSYLRSFPFNKIKIDRTFVADLVGMTDSLAIVQATIQLSDKLGMETAAEGVETREQLELLAAEGCTQIQGFHVSRPVPVSQVPELLASYRHVAGPGRRAAA